MVGDGIVEKFVGLDMSDGDTVFDRCLDACHKIKKVRAGCWERRRSGFRARCAGA